MLTPRYMYDMNEIHNSNWTEWSTIQGTIARIIQNLTSTKCEADLKMRARLLPELVQLLIKSDLL